MTSQALDFCDVSFKEAWGQLSQLGPYSVNTTFLGLKVSPTKKSITETGKEKSKTIPHSAFTLFLILKTKRRAELFLNG